MNMEEQLLPIVPFGKYKDKSVLELLADEKYVEWLKQQSWFSNQKQIYNIVVHQTISTTNNSKTPEHNKLQNLFLDKSNQQKLLSKLFDKTKMKVVYNPIDYQEDNMKKDVNTCGRHAVFRVKNLIDCNRKLEDYYNLMGGIKKESGNTYDEIVSHLIDE